MVKNVYAQYFLGIIFMALFFTVIVYGLQYLDNFYSYVENNVPIIGPFISWARGILRM